MQTTCLTKTVYLALGKQFQEVDTAGALTGCPLGHKPLTLPL